MKNSEKAFWSFSIAIVSMLYFLYTGRRVLDTAVIADDGETTDDFSEDGSLGKTGGRLVFFGDLPDDDPFMLGKLKLKDFRFVHIPKTGGSFIERMFLKKLHVRVGIHTENIYDMIQAQGDSERASIMRRHKCSFWHLPTSTIALYANRTEHEWGKRWLAQPKFTVVRHPVTRMVSEYNYMIAYNWGAPFMKKFVNIAVDGWGERCDPEIFNNFMYNILVHIFDQKHMFYRDCHFVPQVRHITDARGNQQVRYILKQEDLTEEIQTFLENLGHTVTEKEIKKFGGNYRTPPCRMSVSDIHRKTMKKIISVYKEDFEELNYEIPILPP